MDLQKDSHPILVSTDKLLDLISCVFDLLGLLYARNLPENLVGYLLLDRLGYLLFDRLDHLAFEGFFLFSL